MSSWTHLTRSSKLDIRSMTLTGKEGLRGLVLAIATMFSVPNPRYHISNSSSIKDRLVPYDESDEEFLLRFHEMNFNKSHPPPPDSPDRGSFDEERHNSWATQWSRLVRAEVIRRRNAIPDELRAKLNHEPTKDEIKAARDALDQESRTAGFVPLSFGITSPLQWMKALCYGARFDFGVEFEYVRDDEGRIKTKGTRKTKVIDPEKTQYHFGFSLVLMEGGERTRSVRGCSTFEEVMELIESQEYVPEKHAELCGLPMNRSFSSGAQRNIGLNPKVHSRWARERQHKAEEIVRVLTEDGFDTEEKRTAHCEMQERRFLAYWMFKKTHTLTHGEGVSESTFEVGNLWSQFRVCYNAAQKGHAQTPKRKGQLAWLLDDGKATLERLVKASNGKARRHQEAQVSAPGDSGEESASRSNAFAMLEVDAAPEGASAAAAAPMKMKTMAQRAAENRPQQAATPMAKQQSKHSRRKAGEAGRKQAKAKEAAAGKKPKKCRHGMDCRREGCYFTHPLGWCPVAAKERYEAAQAQESAEAAAAQAPPPADEPKGPTAEEMRLAQEVFTQQEELATKDEELAALKAQMEEMKRQLAQQTKAEEKPLPPKASLLTRSNRSDAFAKSWMS